MQTNDTVPDASNPQGLRTRLRLLETGAALLANQGAAPGLVQAAAESIGCPLERAQIYFGRDQDLVLALYLKLNTELAARVPELPEGPVADRFRAIMGMKLAAVEPYQGALQALLGTLLSPRHEMGVLGSQTELVRNAMLGIVTAVVMGATDRPSHDADALARSLYSVHLALMLLWTQDRSVGHRITRKALDHVCTLLAGSRGLVPHQRVIAGLSAIDTVVGPWLRAEAAGEASLRAAQVLNVLFRYRRLLPDAGSCAATPCGNCLALHLPKTRRAIQAGERLHLILPAFPAKSPSPRKVLGKLPDMAEELALGFLQRICSEIAGVYPPGVRLTICSDGHVFSDLVGVSDTDVTNYGLAVRGMIGSLGARSLDMFGMEDLFEDLDFAAMRDHLCAYYAEPLEAIVERTHTYPHHQALFNGIHRFLYEDTLGVDEEKSKTQRRKEARERAYQVIRRSEAWGKLLGECFPTALRLSIHPQAPHSDKIGLLLGDATDTWLTPWHSVAVKEPEGFRLMPRQEAEARGAQPVMRQDRPSYFDLTGPGAGAPGESEQGS